MIYYRIWNIAPTFVSAWDLVLNVFSHKHKSLVFEGKGWYSFLLWGRL